MVTIRSTPNFPRECPVIKPHFEGIRAVKELPRRRWRQIRRIWPDFDAFLRRNGKRARAELEPTKKIKNKTDVSLYFLFRVGV